jgi:hypothetical protein
MSQILVEIAITKKASHTSEMPNSKVARDMRASILGLKYRDPAAFVP